MRIAFVTTEYITNKQHLVGGLGNYLYRVAKALVSLGHDVHIIVLAENQAEFNHDEIQVHYLKLTSNRIKRGLNRLTKYRIPQTLNSLDFSFHAYRKLMQLHQQQPLDIVQFPDWDACGIISSFFLPIPQVTRTSGCRAFWNEKAGIPRSKDEKIMEWLELLQLRQNKHIYAPSYMLKQLLADETQINNVKVIRTPFYLETQDWDLSVYNKYLKDKKYLLFFGRLEIRKGVYILAQALPQVLEKHPDCYAAFVGLDEPSSLAPSMKEYAFSLCSQYKERLIFIENIPHSKLYPVIAGARLVVLPSLIDNLPNACLEAMALGKPVIGTLGASFDEMLTDGETGFLVPIGDVKALATKIHEAWIHPNLNEISQAAKWKVQEFKIERTVQELLNYYNQIIEDSYNQNIEALPH